ncbi:hypothetical protein CHS0354_017372 [Potamilus streckersoni]|uniref:G-protein coupled receptors family 1 profile domain-containing protein n=1 Tax=Potamilus streckersoni TaxID=2493646 RepID=A0AAE0T4W6_9BIVA|nr:hypothetical protein CHS0354_017372 [Potamilus streckersoni]
MMANETENVTDSLAQPNGSANLADPYWSVMEKVIFGTWLSVSALCAVIGNLMVIIVVARHRGMQTRTNMFLVNLAIADFFVGILMAPFSLTTLIKERWIFGETMCKINGFMNTVCFITSIHTLMYISIHKYVSITRPFSRILNNLKIVIMIACAWTWAMICGVLTVFALSTVIYKPRTMQCGPEYPHNEREYIHHAIIQISNIGIPFLIMTFAYLGMYREFRQHIIRLHKNTTLQSDQIIGQQIQVTKTLFIVLACFFLCWIPYAIYSGYVTTVKDRDSIPGWANAAAYCFMYMNSGCNPIIYAWRSPSFREGYKEILCQQPSYIVSDDTIRDLDSPGIIRRLSLLLHSSFKHSARMRSWSRRNSDGASSTSSLKISRSNASCSSPTQTHTLLRRATSKTAKGSSIIKKDGSLIITKNGKIISVRQDIPLKKQQSTFDFASAVAVSSTRKNGISKSLSDINECNQENGAELAPLLNRPERQNKASSSQCDSISDQSELSFTNSPQLLKSRYPKMWHHTSLTKIDSIDTDADQRKKETSCENRLPCDDSISVNIETYSSEKIEQNSDNNRANLLETYKIMDVKLLSQTSNRSDNSAVSGDSRTFDDVFQDDDGREEQILITFSPDKSILEEMPLEPSPRHKLAKSDLFLDLESEQNKKKNNIKSTKSSDVIFTVPLLKGPSMEHLDALFLIPRSSSDASSLSPHFKNSPLYKRRWLSRRGITDPEKPQQ